MRSGECEFDENCTLTSSIAPSTGTTIKLAFDRQVQHIDHPDSPGRFWDLTRGDFWLVVPQYLTDSHQDPVGRIHVCDGFHLGEMYEFEARLGAILRGDGWDAKLDGYQWIVSLAITPAPKPPNFVLNIVISTPPHDSPTWELNVQKNLFERSIAPPFQARCAAIFTPTELSVLREYVAIYLKTVDSSEAAKKR
ncbi:MAG: hypothetical protein HY290_15485 [Planctomycetia bacterium]|nr:hypothetical protein [Planctomycetia bacterium]